MDMLVRRRPRWVSWLPAVVLLIIIAVVAIVSMNLSQEAASQSSEPTSSEITDAGTSTFTDAGIAFIERQRIVKIDLSAAPVASAPIGLADDGTLTLAPLDTGLDYRVSVYGGGEEPGGASFVFSQLAITTEGGAVTGVVGTGNSSRAFASVVSGIEQDSELFGWTFSDSDEAEIVQQLGDATRAGEDYSFGVGPGTRLGFDITAQVTCPASSSCSLDYEIAPAD